MLYPRSLAVVRRVVLTLAVAAVPCASAGQPFVFVVNSAADESDGIPDGDCDIAPPGKPRSGVCTLRAALFETDTNPHVMNRIHFNIPGGGVPKIRPRGTLGSLGMFCPVMVDGTTQPGSNLVEIDGSESGPEMNGIEISGSQTGQGITVRGLVINNFIDGHGILIVPSGTPCGAGFGEPNLVERNFIGTDPTGMIARGNSGDGVRIVDMGNNLIGRVDGGGNVISANGEYGVHITGPDAIENFVRSNFIGVEFNVNFALPNGKSGVFIDDGAVGNVIGGPRMPPVRPPGNVIGGNTQDGIEINGAMTTDNLVQGNRIGGFIGNTRHGVFIRGGANNNVIGDRDMPGRDPMKSNDISANGGDGVRIEGMGANGNWIAINSIFDNGGLGIDLGGDGVTFNDPLDADLGPNTLQNFPVVVLALPDGTVSGVLNSTPMTAFNLDVYSSIACDPSGFGEGQTYLFTAGVVTDVNGNGVFTVAPPAGVVPAGLFITLVASDPAAENFSEFSLCFPITSLPPLPDTCPTVVVNTNDSGIGSLRSAIDCSNSNPGNDTISFLIPGTGVQTIAPLSPLPPLIDAATIDAYSQPGSAPSVDSANPGGARLTIELNGESAGAGADGLRVLAGGSTIRGLVINRFGGNGIVLGPGNGNVVEGSFIGADATATLDRGNAVHGILVASASNVIGGDLGNVIRGNGGAGVAVTGDTSDGNAISHNSIHPNTGPGIDLGNDGPTANDSGDTDSGPNQEMNTPLLTEAAVSAGTTTVAGTLSTTPLVSATLEFFVHPTCAPPGTAGVGERFIGEAGVTAEASGNAGFAIPFPIALPAGQFLSATATDITGNTSEFSPCIAISGGCASVLSGSVAISPGGFRLNRSTGRFVQQLTITNSGSAVPGPLALLVDGLTGATLSNTSGVTSCVAPIGSPFVEVNPGADNLFSPGETLMMVLEFSPVPSQPITYRSRLVSGTPR